MDICLGSEISPSQFITIHALAARIRGATGLRGSDQGFCAMLGRRVCFTSRVSEGLAGGGLGVAIGQKLSRRDPPKWQFPID